MSGLGYDQPQFEITKTVNAVTSVTNVATAVPSKFCLYSAAVLQSVRGIVVTAGTNVGIGGVGNGTDGYSIVVGTTTAGVVLTGSDTAGASIGPFSLKATPVAAGQLISVLHGTETTGVFSLAIQYQDSVV
jgi:hypothetical protein